MKKLLLVLAGCGCLAASAETLTWTGGAQGDDCTNFLAAANWSPAQAPKGGDTLVMNTAVTLAPCEFDFGSAGLTIQNAALIHLNTTFRGTGKLTKDGTGSLHTDRSSLHTGGTLILNGEIYQNARYQYDKWGTDTKYPLGPGTIEIRRTATTYPKLNLQNYCTTYSPILVSGPFTANKQAFYENNNPNVYGKITAEDDFYAFCGWSNGSTVGAMFGGGIDAHGHTAYFSNSGSTSGALYATTLGGVIDASLAMDTGITHLKGRGIDPAATLSVGSKYVRITDTGSWMGTNVVLRMEDSVLELKSAGNLAAYCNLTLAAGAKVDIPSGITVRVAKLTVGGQEKPAGDYTLAGGAEFLTGAGTLRVAPYAPATRTWTGTAGDGKWTTPGNWSGETVPTAGDTALFAETVTLAADTVALLTPPMVIQVAQGKKVTSSVTFTGCGRLAKTGAGALVTKVASTFTGGVDVYDGCLQNDGERNNPWGGGRIDLFVPQTGASLPRIQSSFGKYDNVIVQHGSIGGDGAIYISNGTSFNGAFRTDGDTKLYTGWGTLTMNGDIEAEGHTVRTLCYAPNAANAPIVLNGKVDGNLAQASAGKVTMNGTSPNVDSRMTLEAGRLTISSTGVWGGTNVVVNASAVLELTWPSNLSRDTTIRVLDGGKINLTSDAETTVKALFTNGVAVAAGVHSVQTLPTVLEGTGRIYVGVEGPDLNLYNTWVGGATGSWSDGANWSKGIPPEDGGTAIFNKKVTLDTETVELGEKGLTICNGAELVSYVTFTGTSGLRKTGAGQLTIYVSSTYAGDTVVDNGVIGLRANNALGMTGTLYLNAASETRPQLSGLAWDPAFRNPIVIRGKITGNVITCSNLLKLQGQITCDNDFSCNTTYGPLALSGGVSAPGHTLTYDVASGYQDTSAGIWGDFNASLVLKGAYRRTLGCKGVGIDHTLSCLAGTNLLDSTFSWEGTNIVVSGAKTVLSFGGTGNFSAAAEMRISGGAKLKFGTNTHLNLARLFVDGEEIPAGVYTANDLPDLFLAGAGELHVGFQYVTWSGQGDPCQWSDPLNWSTKKVPTSGDSIHFPNQSLTVSNTAGAVSIAGDLVIDAPNTLIWSVPLEGAGRLVKRGNGTLRVIKTKLQHSGGVSIEAGVLQMDNASALGTGPIWIVRTADVKPQFDLSKAGTGLQFAVPFYIQGPASATWDIQVNNDAQINGEIHAEDDFYIYNCWSNNKYNGTPFSCSVDAPGHVMKLAGYGFVLKGTVNSSVNYDSANNWRFTLGETFRGTDPSATLTTKGTNVFNAAAQWAGNLQAVGAVASVQLAARGNLAKTASVEVSGGATVSIPKGVAVKVGALTVDDVSQPVGIYRKASAPRTATPGATFVGDGRLVVGDPGLFLIVK